VASTTTLKANKLIQNICDTLQNNSSFHLEEDQQWKIICQELFSSDNNDDQYARKQRDTNDDGKVFKWNSNQIRVFIFICFNLEKNLPSNSPLYKAAIRGGGGIRGGGSGIRGGGGGGSGIRVPTSSRYRNTRTGGGSIDRPNGWQWSRTQLIFLPLATRYFYRSRSSSSQYTTPPDSSLTYYYCTPDNSQSVEIECNSATGDTQCCEEQTSKQAYCCGGDIPDYIIQDMNRAAQTVARVFYTLAAVALCMHLLNRRFNR
jgi:hypothetical protein